MENLFIVPHRWGSLHIKREVTVQVKCLLNVFFGGRVELISFLVDRCGHKKKKSLIFLFIYPLHPHGQSHFSCNYVTHTQSSASSFCTKTKLFLFSSVFFMKNILCMKTKTYLSAPKYILLL